MSETETRELARTYLLERKAWQEALAPYGATTPEEAAEQLRLALWLEFSNPASIDFLVAQTKGELPKK